MLYFLLGLIVGVLLAIIQLILENRYRHSPLKRLEQHVPRAVQGVVVGSKTDLQQVLESEEDIHFKVEDYDR